MGKLSMSSADFTKTFVLEDRVRDKERLRKISADYKSTFVKTTEARSANAFKTETPTISSPSSQTSNLPIWRR